jgi:hypothetical protein
MATNGEPVGALNNLTMSGLSFSRNDGTLIANHFGGAASISIAIDRVTYLPVGETNELACRST